MTIIGGKATAGTGINVQFQNGAQIRRNAEQDIYNSFFTGYPNGIFIDGNLPAVAAPNQGSSGSVAKANAGLLQFKNNILAGVQDWGGNGFGNAATSDETANMATAAGVSYPFGSNANFGAPPRGRVVFAGAGAFTSGAFALTGTNEQQIASTSALAWFKSTNEVISRWQDAGINASIFEPLNGTPTLLPASGSKLLSGADFATLTGFTTVSYRGAFGTTDWTTGWVNWNPQATDYSK
jgi:hypothetical protein